MVGHRYSSYSWGYQGNMRYHMTTTEPTYLLYIVMDIHTSAFRRLKLAYA